MSLITTDKKTAVIGLGKTGFSAAQYLHARKKLFVVLDTRGHPPYLKNLRDLSADIEFISGDFSESSLHGIDEIVLSPGIPLSNPAIQSAVKNGVSVIGDIDLFLRENDKPVVAITGSNGKSTVTTLVGAMAESSGLVPGVGGNIGTPVLEFVGKDEFDVFILELSSFQLETCSELNRHIATVLNVTEDHMDRYESFADYFKAKHRIFKRCSVVVSHVDDALTQPLVPEQVKKIQYGFSRQDLNKFSAIQTKEGFDLYWQFEKLISSAQLNLRGTHNILNSLAALSLGHALGLNLNSMVDALKEFPGLEHRCQWVTTIDGVEYINDSKGTNTGATIAALNGLGNSEKNIVLIAGGVGKGADFSFLAEPIEKFCKSVVLIGESSKEIAKHLPDQVTSFSNGLEDAIMKAKALSSSGDTVLLSPACASFDMFESFEDRGNQFCKIVRAFS